MRAELSSAVDRDRLARLVAAHHARYECAPVLLARAPGRINLIGEHTDYNDGFVLPAAIDRDTLIAATPRDDHRARFTSLALAATVEVDLDALTPTGQWSDYPAGVAFALQRAGYQVRGLDLTIESTVPLGGGLSSSAALEVATALAFTTASGLDLAPRDIALLCQRADHEFVGVKSGIMDHFISAHGRRDHALLLDCRSLASDLVPLAAPELAFVVCDSGVRHSHAAGEYNRRRQECEEAVARLQARDPRVTSLRDVTPEQLAATRAACPAWATAASFRRARHVVSENARVLAFIAAFQAGNWPAAGQLLDASHASLRDDYDVSSPELDTLVELAREVDGVLGARLMGGGFGGSTLTLLRRDALDRFTAHVAAGYRARTSRDATIRAVTIVDGAWAGPLALLADEPRATLTSANEP